MTLSAKRSRACLKPWKHEEEFVKSASEQVKELRVKTGLSQAAFARAYGIPRRTVENWESGVNEPPSYVLSMLSEIVALRAKKEVK